MENLRWNPFCKLNTYANKQALWNETHTHAHITHIISSTMSIYDFGCTLFLQKKNKQKIYQMRKDIACVRIMDIFRAIKKIYYNLKRWRWQIKTKIIQKTKKDLKTKLISNKIVQSNR